MVGRLAGGVLASGHNAFGDRITQSVRDLVAAEETELEQRRDSAASADVSVLQKYKY